MNRSTITTIYEHIATLAVEAFNEIHELPPLVMVLEACDNPKKIQMNMLNPGLVRSWHENELVQDVLRAFINTALTPLGAGILSHMGVTEKPPDAIVHVVEGRILKVHRTCEPGEVLNIDQLRKDVEAMLSEHDRLQDHPEHTEALICTVHTRSGCYSGACPITGEGKDRHATVGPMFDGGSLLGRPVNPIGDACDDRTVH